MRIYCLLFSLLLFFISGYSQQKKLDYSIAKWKDNKKAAVSITLDDAINGQFTVALPLLNKYKIKATFFITTKNIQAQLGDWSLVLQAAKDGHEVGNHTVTHPFLHTLPADSIQYQFLECNKLIEQNIPSVSVETMAYPYGDGGTETDSEKVVRAIAENIFIAARATQNKSSTYNSYDFAITKNDYYKVNSEMIADSSAIANFTKHLNETINAGGWYVPTYHGIENGWLIVKKDAFEKHLQELDERKNLLWIAPFSEVIKYHKERNCSTIKVIKETKSKIIFQLADTLNNSIWNEPLTINIKMPWKIKNITQDKNRISFTENGYTLTFNAVPGKGKIIIRKEQN